MANSLFNTFGRQNNPYAGMMQQFQQFRDTFTGDPRQKVMDLLNSGRMTQAQFNQLQGMANQFRQFMGMK